MMRLSGAYKQLLDYAMHFSKVSFQSFWHLTSHVNPFPYLYPRYH